MNASIDFNMKASFRSVCDRRGFYSLLMGKDLTIFRTSEANGFVDLAFSSGHFYAFMLSWYPAGQYRAWHNHTAYNNCL